MKLFKCFISALLPRDVMLAWYMLSCMCLALCVSLAMQYCVKIAAQIKLDFLYAGFRGRRQAATVGGAITAGRGGAQGERGARVYTCLLYTSDAADE